MRLKILFAITILFNSFITEGQILMPSLSPASKIQQQVGLSSVTISFGRPSLRGRKLLGQTNIPFGTIWRLGANEVTTLEVNDEVEIEGKLLKKGKYAMVAIPNKNEWTIILNSDSEQWGVYEYDQKKDIIRFNVKSEKIKSKIETMNFIFEEITPTSSTLLFYWENTKFKIHFSQNADKRVMQQIKEKTEIENPDLTDLMEAAEYYLLMNRDLEQALKWSNKVLDSIQTPFRFNLKAQIAVKLGKCIEAKEAAIKAIEYAKKNGDVAAIALAEEILKNCKDNK
jgi:tetratricopeptide (TPR) repeat protein